MHHSDATSCRITAVAATSYDAGRILERRGAGIDCAVSEQAERAQSERAKPLLCMCSSWNASIASARSSSCAANAGKCSVTSRWLTPACSHITVTFCCLHTGCICDNHTVPCPTQYGV